MDFYTQLIRFSHTQAYDRAINPIQSGPFGRSCDLGEGAGHETPTVNYFLTLN